MTGLLLACQSEISDREDFVPPYFQLEEFITEQAMLLEGNQLSKAVQFGETEEQIMLIPSKEEWLQELDFFIQADINRPALAASYEVSKTDGQITYTLKKGEKSKLKTLVIKLDSDGYPTKVDFEMMGSNTFYESKTEGWLTVDTTSGLIDAFKINGEQKVVFLSPISMEVKAIVNTP